MEWLASYFKGMGSHIRTMKHRQKKGPNDWVKIGSGENACYVTYYNMNTANVNLSFEFSVLSC